MKLSVAVITKNEEKNIVDCLESVKWADEIVLVDSQSTDQTREKAKAYTSKIYEVPFKNFSKQKNTAIEKTTGDWVLILDADERVSEPLAKEIQDICKQNKKDAIYAVKRENQFLGHPLRFTEAKDYPIRLFPRNKARFEQEIHEVLFSDLPVRRIKKTLYHLGTLDLEHYHKKLEQYITLELREMARRGRRVWPWDYFLRPAARFIYLYFFKLGILDGRAGLYYASLSAYYSFLKYWRYRKVSKNAGGN